MVVSFSIGQRSKDVVNTLKRTADNVQFHSYDNLRELVREAKNRHIDFKRIIFSSAILDDAREDLSILNDFISEYSANTEVVIILMKQDAEVAQIFNSMFDSPMYTPVILGVTTSKSLLELVLSDILELKTKYYTFDKGSLEGESLVREEREIQPETVNTFSSYSREVEDTTNYREIEKNETKQTYSENTVQYVEEPTDVSLDLSLGSVENNGKSNFIENAPVLGGVEPFSSEESVVEDSELDLSLGDFGGTHSDTGFLDESEEAILMERLRTPNLETKPVKTEERKFSETRESKPVERGNNSPSIVKRLGLHVDLVTSLRGNGATNSILDEALNIVQTDDSKVLVIDLDNSENGILSFIDVDKFYSKSANDGIAKQRVYSEDGVDIISNGYGSLVTTAQLKSLLTNPMLKKYDIIYIDCPINSLHLLDKELLDGMNILVISDIDRSQLVSTSLALTNREHVSLDVERLIMNKCHVDILGDFSQSEVDFVKEHCLFVNGCWLDRVEM